MITAGTSFTHLISYDKRRDHRLVTRGVYSLFRHPSYVGWFWWSVGTQVRKHHRTVRRVSGAIPYIHSVIPSTLFPLLILPFPSPIFFLLFIYHRIPTRCDSFSALHPPPLPLWPSSSLLPSPSPNSENNQSQSRIWHRNRKQEKTEEK